MNLASINWIAVIICVIANLVIGFLWYSPRTFYPAWRRGQGKPETMEPGSNMTRMWILTIVAAFVIVISMGFVVKAIAGQMPGGVNAGNGALVGLMIWLGFVAPTYLVNNLFANRGFSVWAIEVGNYLVNFVLFGAILGQLH